jgi:hypothetical protein
LFFEIKFNWNRSNIDWVLDYLCLYLNISRAPVRLIEADLMIVKMQFEREKQEVIDRIEKIYEEYNTSVMVWESKISFEPVIGKTYFLYCFDGVNTLSLLSPREWKRDDDFIGAYELNSDRKWIKINNYGR